MININVHGVKDLKLGRWVIMNLPSGMEYRVRTITIKARNEIFEIQLYEYE